MSIKPRECKKKYVRKTKFPYIGSLGIPEPDIPEPDIPEPDCPPLVGVWLLCQFALPSDLQSDGTDSLQQFT